MAQQSERSVTLMAGGDIGPRFPPTREFAALIAPVLAKADIRFGQCERLYSNRGADPQFIQGPGGQHSRVDTSMAEVFDAAHIDVISMASNHAMDWGPDALLDTVDHFRKMGKSVIGAGKDAEAARAPAIIEKNGVRVAFLAYCSVMRDGQAAGTGKVGMAPMRAHTYYSPEEYQPASPPVIISAPHEGDLAAMQADIRAAKERADVVVVSHHWGIRLVAKTVAMYQQPIAHAAIDAGADLILGHHSHCLKAVEVYKGKVCFYSIGNFITTGAFHQTPLYWNLIWFEIDKECLPPEGLYNFPSHCRKTMVAKAVFGKGGVERVSFIPAYINHRAQPYAVRPDDPKFKEIVDYMEWVSDQHPHKFRVDGDEVVIEAP